jgi:hypothetical protein
MTAINDAYINALLADATYVHNLINLSTRATVLTDRTTPKLADCIA